MENDYIIIWARYLHSYEIENGIHLAIKKYPIKWIMEAEYLNENQ